MKNILLIRFSDRDTGNCAAIADHIKHTFMNSNITEFCVNNQNMLSCGSCDYECLKPERSCPNRTDYLQQIMAAIINADMTYFIVPNFCGFPCASYFAFNERTVGYFDGDRELMEKYMATAKRFIFVSNTESENFVNAAKQHSHKPIVLYMKTVKYGKRSIAGDMLTNEGAKADLTAFLLTENP